MFDNPNPFVEWLEVRISPSAYSKKLTIWVGHSYETPKSNAYTQEKSNEKKDVEL